MAIRLDVRTGDVTTSPPVPVTFSLERDSPNATVLLRYKGQTAHMRLGDWPRLVEVVLRREPARWRSDQPIPELVDLPQARALLKLATTTPSYQLLLAGVDFALATQLVEDADEEAPLKRFANLGEGTLPSFTGAGGLFILPRDLIGPDANGDVEELISQNKLGVARASIHSEQEVRHYIPYAVPTGQEVASPGARRLWEAIRAYYYGHERLLPVR